MFGPELPIPTDPGKELLEQVGAAQHRVFAPGSGATRGDLNAVAAPLAAGSAERVRASRNLLMRAQIPELDEGVRIVTAGRTQAGKSTLIDYLTGGDGSTIGVGRQRTTRVIHEYEIHPGVMVVDTPGVGAESGQEDAALAMDAAREADLVVWVQDNDHLPEAAAAALRAICQTGVPIVLMLNCKSRVSLRTERSVMRDIQHGFIDADGHLPRILRVMGELGREPLFVCRAHLAALNLARAVERMDDASSLAVFATRLDPDFHPDRSVLREPDGTAALTQRMRAVAGGSSVDALYSLSAETDRVPFRYARVVEAARFPMSTLESVLREESAELLGMSGALQAQASDLARRVDPILQDARDTGAARCAEILGDFVSKIAPWVDKHVEDADFKKRSNRRLGELAARYEAALGEIHAELDGRLAEAVGQWSQEWVELGETKVRADRSSVGRVSGLWHQRAANAAVGLAGLVVGIALIEVGPLAAIAAGAVTAALQWAVGKLIPGRKEKRQAHVGEATKALKSSARSTHANAEKALRQMVKEQSKRVDDVVDEIRGAADQLAQLSQTDDAEAAAAHGGISTLDQALYRALLSHEGRIRAAVALKTVARVPGVLALCGFDDDHAFAEMALFPLGSRVERYVAVPVGPDCPPVRTAAHALRLGRWPGSALFAGEQEVRIYPTSRTTAEVLRADGAAVRLTQEISGLQVLVPPPMEGTSNDRTD